MTDTGKRLAGPVVMPTSATDLFTATTKTHITCIIFCNETASPVTVSVSLGTDGVGKRIVKGFTLEANEPWTWTGFLPMEDTEKLQHYAGTASAVTIIVSGVEVT